MILLDTDVMVDILRGYEPAITWLTAVADDEIGIPGLVAMELIQGCQNMREQKRIEKALNVYSLYWLDPQGCDRALKSFASHHLSHNIGLLDALIAETAISVDAELVTFNVKHYSVLKELKIIQPYEK
jgi:predicted nucleic acid-binding protein